MTTPHADGQKRDATRALASVRDRVTEPFEAMQGQSAAYRRLLQRARRFAATAEPVLVVGESGTGKTLFARYIHTHSARARETYHVVNLAQRDDDLVGSDLFGHVPGAFTGASRRRNGALGTAHRGTIFLDEIGKSSLAVQMKLLDVLESQIFTPLGSDREVRVDVRFVFAANERLEDLVASGRMLADFLPRLGLFRIELPALRDQRASLPHAIRALVARHAERFGYTNTPPLVQHALEEQLATHRWPGNLRELDALVRRLLSDAAGASELTLDLLCDDLHHYGVRTDASSPESGDNDTRIQLAISCSAGNKSAAARQLGISRSTLYRRQASAGSGGVG